MEQNCLCHAFDGLDLDTTIFDIPNIQIELIGVIVKSKDRLKRERVFSQIKTLHSLNRSLEEYRAAVLEQGRTLVQIA